MEIRTEIEIGAPVGTVWRVLTDFVRYPEWNPFIVAIEGKPTQGAELKVTLSMPETAKEYSVRPRVVRCDPESEFRWLGHLWIKGLMDGEHFFRLEKRGMKTRFIHGEDFSGVLLRFAMRTVTLATRGFVYMNQALKERVENPRIVNGSIGISAPDVPSRF